MLKAALVGLITLFGSELALRLLQPAALQYYRNVKLLHVYNSRTYVGLAPNADLQINHFQGIWQGHFTTNSLGFRGSPEPVAGKKTLACLGDSVVMGFGVSDQDTFCNQLNGVELNGESYQAMNLGVDAFGSLGSAYKLDEVSQKLKLDIALFFVSPNDFYLPPLMVEQGGIIDDLKEAQRDKDESYRRKFHLQFEATRLSYTLQALKLAYAQLRIKWSLTKRGVKQELVDVGKGPGHYLYSAFYVGKRPGPDNRFQCPEPPEQNTVCVDGPPADKDLKPLPSQTRAAYDKMIGYARAKNIELIMVMLPIQNEDLQCLVGRKHSNWFNYNLRSAKYFREKGVRIMDLRKYVPEMCGEELEGLKRGSQVRDYFIPMDGHYTKLGNRWASRAIKSALKDMYAQKR